MTTETVSSFQALSLTATLPAISKLLPGVACEDLSLTFAPMTLAVWRAIGSSWEATGEEDGDRSFHNVGDGVRYLHAPGDDSLDGSYLLVRHTRRVSHADAWTNKTPEFLAAAALHLENGANDQKEAEEFATFGIECALLDADAASVWALMNDCFTGRDRVLAMINAGRDVVA